MFTRKHSRLINFLLLSGFLSVTVRATGITSCSDVDGFSDTDTCSNTNDTDLYCLNTDGKIYSFKTSDSGCSTAVYTETAGIYAFEDDGTTNAGATLVTLGSSGTVTTEANLKIYQCLGNPLTCTQTYGYILVGTKYCGVSSATGSCTESSSVSGSCVADSNSGSLYKNGDKIELCLFGDSTSPVTTEMLTTGSAVNHLMYNVESNIFTGVASSGPGENKYVVVQASPNAFILDTRYANTAAGNYITDSSNKIITTSSETGTSLYTCTAAATNYCEKNTSIPTGFLSNGDTINGSAVPYIQCSSTECKAIAVSGSACSASNIGGLIKDSTNAIKLCVTDSYSVALSGTAAKYVVSINVDGTIFGTKADKYVIVEVGGGTVSLVDLSSAAGYYIASGSTNTLLTSTTGTGNIYNCEATGTCSLSESVVGYLKNADATASDIPYIECTTTGCSGIGVESGSGCTSATPGLLYENSGKYLCIKDGATAIPLATGSGKYLVNAFGAGEGNFFLVDIANGNVIRKDIDEDGYYLADATTNALVTTADAAGTLYNCSSNVCTVVDEDDIPTGYIVNGEGTLPYIKCTGGTCTGIAVSTGIQCSAIDSLYSVIDDGTGSVAYYFCVLGSGSGIDVTTTGKYFISIEEDNTFGDENTGKSVIVELTGDGRITLMDIASDGNYIADKTTNALVTTVDGPGDLYTCVGTGKVCEKTAAADLKVGYFLNAGDTSTSTVPYIKCKSTTTTDANGNESTSIDCSAIAVSGSACSATTIGSLIKDDTSTIKLCVSASSAVALTGTSTKYVMSINVDGTIFGEKADNYVLMDVSAGTATLVDLSAASKAYYIANSSTNALLSAAGAGTVYLCDTGVCSLESTTVGYLKNADTSAATAIPYIQCNPGSGTAAAIASCSAIAVSDGTDCTGATAGSLYKVASGTTYHLCIKAGADAIALASGTGQYLVSAFGASGTSYSLVEVGSESVIKKSTKNGYYIAGEDDQKIVATGGAAGSLHQCSAESNTCSAVETVPVGYVVNAGDADPSAVPYIKCSSTECKALAVSGTGCTAIDTMYSKTENSVTTYYFCALASGTGIALTDTATGQYFISVATSNTFGNQSGCYVKIDVSNKNVLLHGKDDPTDRYEFTGPDEVIIDKNHFDTTTKCSNGALNGYAVSEYKKKEGVTDTTNNYYEKLGQ